MKGSEQIIQRIITSDEDASTGGGTENVPKTEVAIQRIPGADSGNNELVVIEPVFSSEYIKKSKELDEMYIREIKKLETYIKTQINDDSIKTKTFLGSSGLSGDKKAKKAKIAFFKKMPEKGIETRVDIDLDGGEYGITKIDLIISKVRGPFSTFGDSMNIEFEQGDRKALYDQLDKIKNFLNTGEFPETNKKTGKKR